MFARHHALSAAVCVQWDAAGGQIQIECPARTSMNRFQVLDSWRGICACLVALMHFPAFTHVTESPLLANSCG